jgi:hypothetical protein
MAVPYYGDFAEDDTVLIPFNTFDSNDPSQSVTVTDLADADIKVHKDGAVAEIVTDGATVTINFDGITGNHLITIDTSVDAAYSTGSEYAVRLEGITVDAGTLNVWVGAFSIERAGGALAVAKLAATAAALATAQTDLDTITDTDGVIVGAAGATAIVDEFETQSQADPTGFHVNVKEINATAQTAGDVIALANSSAAWGLINSGVVFRGVVSAADPGVSFTIGGLAGQGAGAFIDANVPWYAYVFRDAGGAAAAPQGEQQQITGYTTATGLFTTNAFTVPIAVGDDVFITNGRLASIPDILVDTAEIGAAGVGLTEAGGTGDHLTALATAAICTEGRLAELDAANLPADIDTIVGKLPSGIIAAGIQKNVAKPDIPFLMVSPSDHVTPVTGLTPTVTMSQDGASTFTSAAGTVAEIANGWYSFDATQADMNADLIIFKFADPAADSTGVTYLTSS